MNNVIIYHNVIAPYRNALFLCLSKKIPVEVWFAREISRDRQWDPVRDDRYPSKMLGSIEISLGKSIVVTPHLWYELERARPTAVVSVICRPNILDAAQIALWCRIRKVPFIGWVANAEGDVAYGSTGVAARIADRVRSWVLSRASGFWSYSTATDSWLGQNGFTQPRITGTQVLGPPLMPARVSVGDSQTKFPLLYVGKLDARKGLGTLVEAIRLLSPEVRSKIHVAFAGDGPLKHFLTKELEGLVEFDLYGHLNSQELAERYAAAEALVLPSEYDPWGFVVNEAMATGTPAIVSDRCGAAELAIRAGWVFRAGSATALADAIEEAFASRSDNSLRIRAREAESLYRADTASEKLADFTSGLAEPLV